MKHLTTYKLFESLVEVDDLKDMLSYLSDDMFNVQVKEGEHHVYSKCVEVTISKDGGDFYFWNGGNTIEELTPFTVGEIKEYLLRSYKYMVSEGWSSFNFEIVTYDTTPPILGGLSRKFTSSTYTTPIGINDNMIYSTMYPDREYSPEYADGIIKDDQEILCVYIGFGKD
jgi:hypothetical protein